MHRLNRPSKAGVWDAFLDEISARAAVAFAAGCRLAFVHASCDSGCCIGYDFVVLSPGEAAPDSWTIVEEAGGVPRVVRE